MSTGGAAGLATARRRGGFSLVEAVVALTVLGTGVLAVTGAGVAAGRHLASAEAARGAARLAARVADSLAAHPAPGDGALWMGGRAATWTITWAGRAGRLRIEVVDGTGAAAVFETILTAPLPRLGSPP